MRIYKLLGDGAEEHFARSWGVSYGTVSYHRGMPGIALALSSHYRRAAGMNAATEWLSVVKEAAKGALFLMIMERLRLTPPAAWLDQHIDYLSLCVAAHHGCVLERC
jgi:hypothetical protein